MPAIVSIVYTPATVERKPPDRYARVSVENALLVEDIGIDGDLKGSRGRQLNIMSSATLEELRVEGFHIEPGEMGEQIVIAGIDLASLQPGDRLRLGESAIIEVVLPRTGCDRFEHIQGKPKQSVKGRLGVMARVVRGGDVQVGDTAMLLSERERR